MKPPVLVLAPAAGARAIRAALADDYALTVTDDVERARGLAATNAFHLVLAVPPLLLEHALVVDGVDGAAISAAIERSITVHREHAQSDAIGALAYDDFVDLARYAVTRRYLLALLSRHGGSVTDAARGAKLKRESLHRLMRKHHVTADDFRER